MMDFINKIKKFFPAALVLFQSIRLKIRSRQLDKTKEELDEADTLISEIKEASKKANDIDEAVAEVIAENKEHKETRNETPKAKRRTGNFNDLDRLRDSE